MKKTLSFKVKLLGLCLFMAGISTMIGFIGYQGLERVEGSYGFVADTSLPNLENINDMYLSYRSVRINLRTLGLPGLTKEQGQHYVTAALDAIADYEKSEKKYLSLPFQPGEEERYKKLDTAWEHFKEVGARAIDHYKSGTPDAKEKLMKIFLEECPEAAKNYTLAVNELKGFLTDTAHARVADAKAAAARASQWIFLCGACGVLFGLAISFIFAVKMSTTIMEVANALAANAEQVSSASTQIAGSSQELSQAATEQASSLEETAASLEEITAMIAKASDSAESTATSSSESHKKAEEGRAAVDLMLNSMDEISQSNEAILTQINESNRQMTEIVKVIQDIGSKTKVINEIVFQTKLLSFNASVEAARAGEHGKGFAVVAEEVGNLAQMSGNAAKEISEMLDGSISKVEKIVDDTKTRVEALVQSGKEKVESGVSVAKQCSDVLNEIVQNVSRVSGLSQEISQANKEQAQGVGEINKAMAQLDTVTQQNASTSEEAASAAEQLSTQAESLKSSVKNLILVIQGGTEEGAQWAPPPKASASPKIVSKQTNVVRMKAPKKAPAEKMSFKRAAGDDSVPSRDDDGFRDV